MACGCSKGKTPPQIKTKQYQPTNRGQQIPQQRRTTLKKTVN